MSFSVGSNIIAPSCVTALNALMRRNKAVPRTVQNISWSEWKKFMMEEGGKIITCFDDENECPVAAALVVRINKPTGKLGQIHDISISPRYNQDRSNIIHALQREAFAQMKKEGLTPI
ncbi:MAG: hypothetical protein ABFQ53_00225 [Patescibacteria group bacterium]